MKTYPENRVDLVDQGCMRFMKKGDRHQWHLDKPICMERSSLYPEKKAGGLMAISRSVTEGNHRNSLGNNMKRWKRGRNGNQYERCLSKKQRSTDACSEYDF